MANRSYLYSLSNRPSAYADRPETISGLSEWPYDIPFIYRLLMSGDPQLCASLISDGFEDEEPGKKTKLHAISSRFDLGFARVKRFIDIVSTLVAPGSSLAARLEETTAFLEAHRDSHLLLETAELDTMSVEEEVALRACVEQEIARCLSAGAAVDALPHDIHEAGLQLKSAAAKEGTAPFDAFFGLRLDDDCDNTRGGATKHPLGLYCSDQLGMGLWNRAQFEAKRG